MKYNNGGTAFPSIGIETDMDEGNKGHVYSYEDEKGMTLWDYFACKGMELASDVCHDMDTESAEEELNMKKGTGVSAKDWPRLIAKQAFDFADAMIAEREKRMKGEK